MRVPGSVDAEKARQAVRTPNLTVGVRLVEGFALLSEYIMFFDVPIVVAAPTQPAHCLDVIWIEDC